MQTSNHIAAEMQVLSAGNDHIEEWVASRALSKATVRAYVFETTRFVQWAESTEGSWPEAAAPGIVVDYLNRLASDNDEVLAAIGIERPLRTTSLLQAKRIVASFATWMVARGYAPGPTISRIHDWVPPKRPPLKAPVVKRESLRKTLRELRKQHQSETHARRALVIALAFWLGASPKEIANLRRSAVRRKGSRLEIRLPRRVGKSEWVIAPKEVTRSWEWWDQLAPPSEYVVCSLRGECRELTASAIARIVRGRRMLLGSPSRPSYMDDEPTTSRGLRNTATELLREQGWGLVDIRSHFRRKNMKVTGIEPRASETRARDLERIEI